MSLCLAREGNFCAKLTWCPLAGRWRLVSGSDLHQPVYYTSISSSTATVSLAARQRQLGTETHRKLRNTIIASLREERRGER